MKTCHYKHKQDISAKGGSYLPMKIILIMAQSLDGKISRSSEEFIDWTGSADKKMFAEITKRAGVIIMGSKTFDTIGKPLPGRKNIVLTRNTQRKSESPNLIYTDKQPQELIQQLEKEGYSEAAVVGGAQINTLFARENLIDEYLITVAPTIFGQGLSLFTEALDIDLELVASTVLEKKFLLLKYKKAVR